MMLIRSVTELQTFTPGRTDGQTLPSKYAVVTFALLFRIAAKGDANKHDASPPVSVQQESRILTDRPCS